MFKLYEENISKHSVNLSVYRRGCFVRKCANASGNDVSECSIHAEGFKGWVGQYVYEIKFEGRQSLKPWKFDHLYDIKINRVHTGFVELTSEVRGAIRTNQPDKNNGARWESWIPIGTKKQAGQCRTNSSKPRLPLIRT